MPKKGYKQSPEHLEKNRLARTGHTASDATREKMRLSHSGEKNHNFGKVFSEETRKKIGDSRRGDKNPLYGTHRPEYIKKAIGDANRGEKHYNYGKQLSEEVKEKIRIATSGEKNHNYGKAFPNEVCLKIAKSRIGQKTSLETRIKMRTAQKGEKAHAWKGGISYEPYCPKFTKEFKDRVRAFFGYKCQICGHVWKVGEHLLAVHHVNYLKAACCSDIVPLFVPLCHQPCHTKTNHNREIWKEYFTDIINNEFDGKCYYSFEEMSEKKKDCGD